MPDHLSKRTLLIISDTAMWRAGHVVHVFEPTLREVEWLAGIFERVTWIGFDYGTDPAQFARATLKTNIDFILLPKARGGKSLLAKLKILRYFPIMIGVIIKQIGKNAYIHTRAPSVPALITMLFSYFDRSRTYWHKYAGNWKQEPAPWAYALQRFMLRKNSHTVSVNGLWPNEPCNIINLENPCLTKEELIEANDCGVKKSNSGAINICFVGGLIAAKGIHQFIDSLGLVKQGIKIGHVYVAGDGAERQALEHKAVSLAIPISFLGNIKREAINKVYHESHIIVLPSVTEGFPKVIAEAAAFGCIPIVTNVSSIGQYIQNGKNGLLLADTNPVLIAEALDSLLNSIDKMEDMRREIISLSSMFTYERYCTRVVEEIFKRRDMQQ